MQHLYPVCVQLKLRQVLKGSDIEKALATVSSHTVQEKMRKEHEKIEEEQEKMQKNRRINKKSARVRPQVTSAINRNRHTCRTTVPLEFTSAWLSPIPQRSSNCRLSALTLNQSWMACSMSPSISTITIFQKSSQSDMFSSSADLSNISDQQLMNQPRS